MSVVSKIRSIIKSVIPKPVLRFLRNYILVKPSVPMFKNLFRVFTFPVRNMIYLKEINNMDKSGKLSKNTVFELFNKKNDEFWFWIFSRGYFKNSVLREIIPVIPPEEIQLQYTGKSGDETINEAFFYYSFIKKSLEEMEYPLRPDSKVLDFGCGWGRIIRFFMKDVYLKNLYGTDCDETVVNICKSLNVNCNIDVNNIYPPTEYPDNNFDLIYSFSVFSHLSEESHKKWLSEFQRILKPNGVLIVTTRPREFILSCKDMRTKDETKIPFYAKGLIKTFVDTEKYLKEYDDGNYLYESVGGGGIRDGSFYGETCIPEKYAEREWVKYFNKVKFVSQNKHNLFNQSAIIAKNKVQIKIT